MKPYSLDLRQKVVQAYKQGNDSYRQLAKRFQVSLSFVQRLLKRDREQGTLLPQRLGTPTVSRLKLYREQIVQDLQECNDLTLAQLCQKLESETSVKVSISTMCRFLKQEKLTRKKKRGITQKQKQKKYNC